MDKVRGMEWGVCETCNLPGFVAAFEDGTGLCRECYYVWQEEQEHPQGRLRQ